MGNICSCSRRSAASSLLLPYVTAGSDRRSPWATPAGAQSFVLPTHLAVYCRSRLMSNATSGCSVCTKEKTRMHEALALQGWGNSWEARLLPHRRTWVGLFTHSMVCKMKSAPPANTDTHLGPGTAPASPAGRYEWDIAWVSAFRRLKLHAEVSTPAPQLQSKLKNT